MASWSKNFSSGWATLIVNVSESGTSSATNQGTISWSIRVKKIKSCSSYNNGGASIYLNIGGTRRYTGSSFDIRSLGVGSTKTIASGSFKVTHSATGTLSLAVAAGFTSGVGLGSASLSGTFTGVTIPRATTPTLSASSVALGSAVTITMSRASSSFDHTVSYAIGDASGTIGSDLGTSVTWTPPLSLANQLPSATSGKVTITCKTYNGSTLIGTKTVQLTVTIPSSVKPSISSVAVSEAVTAVTSAFGNRYVKTLSQLNVNITAAGSYGSTISSYKTELDGVVYISKTFTSNALNTAGTVPVKVTVTDSRGRTATTTKNITVVDYTAPTITSMTYYPCNSAGTQTSNGTYTKVTITGVIASVANQNSRSLTLKYKKATATTYTTKTLTVSAYSFTVSTIISGTDPTVTYEYVATLSDKISSTTHTISTGVPVLSFYKGGKGARFFGEANKTGLEISGRTITSSLTVGAVDMTLTTAEYDELLEIADSFDGGLISQDWNTWHKANTANGTYTITKTNNISVLKLTANTNYVGIYAPQLTPRKADLQNGTIVFSIWVKKLTSGTIYPVQFRVMTGDASENLAGGGYWTHGFNSGYSNNPTVTVGKWVRWEVKFTWAQFLASATQYDKGFTTSSATGLGVRITAGSTTLKGDMAEYKLPRLYTV